MAANNTATVDILAYLQVQNVGYNYSIAEQITCKDYDYGHNQIGGYCLKDFVLVGIMEK